MDQVVCPECAEMVFIHDSMTCDHVVLRFRGDVVLRSESTSNFQYPSDPVKSSKFCLWRVWVDGGAATAAQTVRMDDLLCQECVEVVLVQWLMSCDGLRL